MFTEKTYASFYRNAILRYYTALFSIETTGMTPNTNRVTIRLSKSTLEELRREASEKDLPLSSLIVKILNKNVSFDSRHKSIPNIIISQALFMEIIENLDESTFGKITKQGPKIVKKLCTLSGWKYDFESIIDNYFVTLAKYCSWFRFKYFADRSNYQLVFETSMGERWTKFLSLYVISILDSLKVHIYDESVDDGVIIFKLGKR